MKLILNGCEVQANEGQTLLELARANRVYIPTLCHAEAVDDYGSCRMCLVEVSRRGRSKLVTACLYPVEEGIEVKTDTDKVNRIRHTIIELLLARCPNSDPIREMAASLGVTLSRFSRESDNADNQCTLCGLCTRVCSEIVGVSAISLVNRGTSREVALPFYDDAASCIACGSCAFICPTGAIKLEDLYDKRVITWPNSRMEFKLKECKKCGMHFAPAKQLTYMADKTGLPLSDFELCPDCR